MTALRKFYYARAPKGFFDGFARGLAASVDLFQVPQVHLQSRDDFAVHTDVEAIRSDVERAKRKLAREIDKNGRVAQAS